MHTYPCVYIYIYKRIQTYINICIYKCFVCRFDCGIQLEDFICPCLSIEVKSICLLFRFCVTPSASLCPGSSLRFFSVRTLFDSSFLFCSLFFFLYNYIIYTYIYICLYLFIYIDIWIRTHIDILTSLHAEISKSLLKIELISRTN
jgi:small-conductance mechanosensitive channel